MSITLRSFLQTHPISLLENLKNVCQEVGLESEGTKTELQNRIIAFVDKEIDSSKEQWNKDRDAEVAPDKILLLGRDLANQKGHDTSKLINRHIKKTLKGNRNKPSTSAEIHLEPPKTTSNQQMKTNSRHSMDKNGTSRSTKKRRIDQIENLDDEDNSQTPLFDDENEEEEHEEEAADEWEEKQIEEDEDEESEKEEMDTVGEEDEKEEDEESDEEDELEKTINEIQEIVDDVMNRESTSSSAAPSSSSPLLSNSSPTTETIASSQSTTPSSCEKDYEIDEKELDPMEKKYYFILSQSATILACKDEQIEKMASIITEKDTQLEKTSVETDKKDQQIEKLIKMNKEKSQQIDKLMMTMNARPLAEATQDIEDLKTQQAEQTKINGKLATIADKTTTKLREIKTQLDGDKSKSKQTKPQLSDDQGKLRRPKETKYVDLTSPIPNKQGVKKTALVIGDSTTDKIEAEKLHEEKEVKIIKRFSLNEAVKDPPTCRQKEQVSDVMLIVGLNDTKDPKEKTASIMSNYGELIDNYTENFPKAKVHISGVAPVSTQQENVNSQLEDLAKEKNVNYVPLQGFYDRNTGIIRPNMVKGSHLTECGTRTLAKTIKSALYGRETRPREALQQPTNLRVKTAGSQNGPDDLKSLMNSMANFFNTASSKINEK